MGYTGRDIQEYHRDIRNGIYMTGYTGVPYGIYITGYMTGYTGVPYGIYRNTYAGLIAHDQVPGTAALPDGGCGGSKHKEMTTVTT